MQRARSDSAKAERRRTIMNAATTLLEARGLHNLTMQDIATACGLTKPALYHYFPTREDLVLTVYRDLLNAWMAAFNRSLLGADASLPRAEFNSLFVSGFAARPLLCHLTNHVTATLAPKLTGATLHSLNRDTAGQLAGLSALFRHYGYAEDGRADDLARAYHTILVGAAQIAARDHAASGNTGNPHSGMIDRARFEAACLATLDCLR